MSASASPATLGGSSSRDTGSQNRWIISPLWDQLLIVSTPLLIVPIVFLLASPWVGVEVETIALVVTAFFALGHHLPGMLRAYGDKELFHRFRLRFILTPLTFVGVSYPLYRYHYDFFLILLYFWGAWHGLMQLYGFVRIYDAKVGSNAPVTAYLDWLMCLSWFPTALMFSEKKTADLLGFWYSFGGPLVPASAIAAFRALCLAFSIAVLAAFIVNYAVQSFRGQAPNPVKLLMLVSGIGFWWFSFVYVQFSGLSVTLFEISHDVQYMAITWMYNCRRVTANSEFARFLRFVFRRGMVLLYLGLIAGYGAIGMAPSLVRDGTLFAFVNAFILMSTILHYYYDGFIWKVREKSTQAGLGVADGAAPQRSPLVGRSGFAHFLKWSPVMLFVGWLFVTDVTDASLPPSKKLELKRRYEEQLLGSAVLPKGGAEQSWLYAEFEQAQKLAASVPGDADAQIRAAILLANFGRNDEAKALLTRLLQRQPNYANGDQLLGEIELHLGNIDRAEACFRTALAHARTRKERANSKLKLCEVELDRGQFESARSQFDELLQDNPGLESAIKALRDRVPAADAAK